ncbi:uncharacterized protein HD556DRAFT_1450042 [Suillus plorans]|uniref:Uncharacterized protein n=1 Tax=Suillus plorans TaxID=116603 RepID=A0A9P7ADE4_9AGAM|nr:uncharacterized protein HD556DRAFT_1450042 [Suillus plorans]KAG1786061.1 hypothetical protein HD556DRAFT_1450042 [Suillus plorans]
MLGHCTSAASLAHSRSAASLDRLRPATILDRLRPATILARSEPAGPFLIGNHSPSGSPTTVPWLANPRFPDLTRSKSHTLARP